ncbi:putative GPI-anchored cell surface glycoprotein [Aspergillus neoniger CBS 115656]|uniref:GPI-anchored cell surface glyco protein n=1 Tax=Aspergillus neoniger (strain CBS 115656) TaxID=1448310 RepID=A0A318YNT5_ASPNB|nr:GPI-anchored cell surface glyco protein [Aspergillus neoniger CBS 115656]PYH36281.1 GPI-anchored cell surface glyco protein [Aspergillus neoniger CBS 115656]
MEANNTEVVGRASVARELGSPAALSLDLTPRETRRSSSRASRKTTREPEALPSNLSHSSISLPPTPVTTSFEEQLSSSKRRKTHRSATVDEKIGLNQESAQTPKQQGSGGPSQISNSVSKKRGRGRKSALANGETVQPATPASNPKQQSQSTLHNFLSRTLKDRRKSLVTQNPSTNPTMSTSNVSSPAMNSSASNSRKTRKSMPAKLNGFENSEKTSSVDSTSSLTSTPNAQSGKADKAPANSAASATTAEAAEAQEASTKLATPATQPRSTPRTTTARSRRAERKSRAMAAQNSKSAQSTPVSAVNSSSHKPVNSLVATRTSSRPQRSTRKSAINAASLAVDDASLETPSVPKTPFGREVADSIESTPALDSKAEFDTMSGYDLDTPGIERSTPYGESFPFEYHADMYGNKFGLDGSNEGPGSPTASYSTTTSAARTSGRTRKPTIKAMESLESERRFRRNRAPSSKPESALKEVKGKAAVKKTRANKQANAKTAGIAQASKAGVDGKWAVLANRLLDLAAAAVAPEFEQSSEAEGWVEELRKEYMEKQEKKTETPAVQSEAEPVIEAASEAQPQAEIGVEGISKPISTSETHRWTDEDGFIFTGQKNKFGEELVVVGEGYSWFRPNNTYGDKLLPQPPIRLKSHEQFEKDRIFGYPPRMGERNLPQDNKMPFFFENVDEVKATIKAREEARKRGIAVDRMMPAAYIQTLIAQHDETAPKDGPGEVKEAKETKEPTRKRRRGGEASETTQVPKRRRREPEPEPTPPAEPPKTLRIKLTLKGGAGAATRKRSHSEMEDQPAEMKPAETKPAERKSQQERSSPSKILKLGLRRNYTQEMIRRTTPEDLAMGPPEPPKDIYEAFNVAPPPGPPPRNFNTAPGGRPRRRAAAALIAEFQNHAEERARRANARKRNVPSDKPDDPNTKPNGQPNGQPN